MADIIEIQYRRSVESAYKYLRDITFPELICHSLIKPLNIKKFEKLYRHQTALASMKHEQ